MTKTVNEGKTWPATGAGRRRLIAALTVAATAAVLMGCSSGSDDDAGASPAPEASSSAPAAPPSPATPEASSSDAAATAPVSGDTPITLTVGDQTITATLNDSAVSRDFVASLPVTLPWFRNGSIEYITELGAPMTETGPFYTDVQPGDLVYYNPRDSLTIIYAPTSSVPTLTKMGEITSDLSVFEGLPDDIDITIELA